MQEAGFEGAASWWQRPPHAWRPGERLLACAAAAVAELRAAVHAELGYTCSAGVAHTKLMAKLCSGCVPVGGKAVPAAACRSPHSRLNCPARPLAPPPRRLHKPAQQTVLPASAVPALLGPLPIPKLKGLGGKFGEQASMGVLLERGAGRRGPLRSAPACWSRLCPFAPSLLPETVVPASVPCAATSVPSLPSPPLPFR